MGVIVNAALVGLNWRRGLAAGLSAAAGAGAVDLGAAEVGGVVTDGMSETVRTVGAAWAARMGRVDDARTSGPRWMREDEASGDATSGAMRWSAAMVQYLELVVSLGYSCWARRGGAC